MIIRLVLTALVGLMLCRCALNVEEAEIETTATQSQALSESSPGRFKTDMERACRKDVRVSCRGLERPAKQACRREGYRSCRRESERRHPLVLSRTWGEDGHAIADFTGGPNYYAGYELHNRSHRRIRVNEIVLRQVDPEGTLKIFKALGVLRAGVRRWHQVTEDQELLMRVHQEEIVVEPQSTQWFAIVYQAADIAETANSDTNSGQAARIMVSALRANRGGAAAYIEPHDPNLMVLRKGLPIVTPLQTEDSVLREGEEVELYRWSVRSLGHGGPVAVFQYRFELSLEDVALRDFRLSINGRELERRQVDLEGTPHDVVIVQNLSGENHTSGYWLQNLYDSAFYGSGSITVKAFNDIYPVGPEPLTGTVTYSLRAKAFDVGAGATVQTAFGNRNVLATGWICSGPPVATISWDVENIPAILWSDLSCPVHVPYCSSCNEWIGDAFIPGLDVPTTLTAP